MDLMAGKITTQLGGQNKTADVTVAVNNSQGQQMLSTPDSSAQSSDSFSDTFRTLIQAGQQYGSVTATWDSVTVSVPVNSLQSDTRALRSTTRRITHFVPAPPKWRS